MPSNTLYNRSATVEFPLLATTEALDAIEQRSSHHVDWDDDEDEHARLKEWHARMLQAGADINTAHVRAAMRIIHHAVEPSGRGIPSHTSTQRYDSRSSAPLRYPNLTLTD
jgi:hypothetical protein